MRQHTKDGVRSLEELLAEQSKGRFDCGGPLDGWNLSPEDVALYIARHRQIQNPLGPSARQFDPRSQKAFEGLAKGR